MSIFYLPFSWTAITLLIAVSIMYCYLIKYRAKQKHLLPFDDKKLKQVYIDNANWKWTKEFGPKNCYATLVNTKFMVGKVKVVFR